MRFFFFYQKREGKNVEFQWKTTELCAIPSTLYIPNIRPI